MIRLLLLFFSKREARALVSGLGVVAVYTIYIYTILYYSDVYELVECVRREICRTVGDFAFVSYSYYANDAFLEKFICDSKKKTSLSLI